MKIIACVDDKYGMAFYGRRQSSDRVVCERLLQLCQGHRLCMNAYSGKLFADADGKFCVSEDFLEKAVENDFCFVENVDVLPYLTEAEEIILFRWNRVYPSDLKFPGATLSGYVKVDAQDFSGNSHECITMEVYRR